MAGGVHASSPGSATVTHQMGHSVLPPEYTLHSQTVLENGVSLNESSNNVDLNVETSTSRKRKLSTDATNHQLDSKRTCLHNHLLTDMVIKKEKYLYISLLDKYGCGNENDFFNCIDKFSYSESVLPFPKPHQPKPVYLSSEPDHFKTSFQNDLLLPGLKKVIKQESNESIPSPPIDYNSKSYSPIVLIRPACRGTNFSAENNSQQIAEKAKQEAYVLQRVAELQKSGLWTEKRLPKIQEPPRVKAHWDYVLEELEWLATDFAQERKWKKAAARKRSRMVQKHFQEREALVHKAAKAAELHKRRIASHLAKMVKSFWNNVEKLVDFKQQTKLKEKRQQALDQHLSFIVDKTEKYSSLVAESMNKSAMVSNQDTSRSHSPEKISDAEFEPNQSSSDDEETIEAEERGGGADVIDHNKEIEMLKRESELPLEDLLNQLPEEYLNNVETIVKTNDKKHIDDEDEYVMEGDVSDDESTLLEEEKIQGKVDYKSEIAELEADNNLSIEDLMKKYNSKCAESMENSTVSSHSESSSESSPAESNAESSASENDNSDNTDGEENGEDDDGSDDLLSLLKDSTLENGDMNEENADEKIDDVAAIAESIQPKGNTLSSTCVVTKVPFLLKHSLREYQHIGLDWLVTMYERKLNGILADEMGLGKTIQTIALLAHLATDKEDWGPHLIIVPTSVMLNWEMEFKKWCPAFKILTYYGNPKERKLKRSGWTKPNTFHVCITSYKLVLQDHHCFRRKKWKYLILDEAQNIKNFKSQRWQRLLNFDSERRLLLTGTPLQNNLMELWSLMHFLMPNLFASHREFKEWFSNPVTGMIEGNSEYNENIIKRLHKVLRPFLLRRLKIEVEKQLPSKTEHVLMCRLSNRQRYLYDDFMSRAKTKETLSCGNLLSVINVLMQLRKVCNHPNLFESRPIVSPFQMEALTYHTASLVDAALDYCPFEHVNLEALNLKLVDAEERLTAWGIYRLKRLHTSRKLIEEIDEAPSESPPCPKEMISVRLKTPNDLSCIKLNSNAKGNTKITSFFKTLSAPASQESSGVVNNTVIAIPKPKLAPIFRTVIAHGEVNNMAVKITKPLDNTTSSKSSIALQLQGAKINAVSQKIGIAKSTSSTPIHGTVLKNMLPVSIKNTQTQLDGVVTSSVASVSTNALIVQNLTSTSSTSATASVNVLVTPSTSYATIASSGSSTLLPVSLPVTSTSMISIASSGSSPSKLGSIVQSTGKSVILATSNSVNKTLTSTLKTTAGQRLLIRLPQVPQTAVLNNMNNIAVASTSNIILNNTQKTSIAIPKPISTFVTSTVALSTVTSSVTQSNTVSSVGVTTRSKNESKLEEKVIVESSELIEKRKLTRKEKLRMLGIINERKSSPYVMFGCDVRNTLKVLDVDNKCPPMSDLHYWKCAGHVNCINAQYAKHVYSLCYTLTNALSNSVQSIEERIQELSETFSRFIVYVPSVNARRPSMHVSHPNPSKNWSLQYMECALEKELAPRSKDLHQIVSRMSTAFPDSRLIQYDCGKLQTLDRLLRELKAAQHRVLIFTQMARMLDVLETFLTFHGHIYLRLDGSTRIDQRQVLMERFNADKRYFCFILSTRSGGIGVNLTGADTVIFYDSDWNPTMDAQAQDRCHRIGQTRDVHIYRLISEKTIEENILKKANQKKLLGDLAIEGGNFTTAYFKSTTIHDLFNVDFEESDPAKRMKDITSDANSQGVEKSTLNAYENALAAAEDEPDVNAAKTAKEEAVAELAEFDENIPLVDNDGNGNLDASLPTEECSKAEQKVNALLEQLTPIERWALQFMETVDAEWAEEQLAAAEAEIEQQKKEWEMERLAIEQADERSKRLEDDTEDDDAQLVYSSEDSKNQAWLSFDTFERMPIWLPLPPLFTIDEEYIDRSLNYLYQKTAIPEHLLPPIYYRKEKKKLRLDQPSSNVANENSAHTRIRNRHRDGLNATLSVTALEPPKSLFDRPSPVVAKLRQDMRLQKYRGLSRSTVPNVPGLKPYFPPKINADPEFVPEWLIHEDYALLQAIQHVQELPLNLSVMYPGHTPNWDLVSELVNQVSRIYRSPQQCKNRFETAILPREEGKLPSDPISKKQKKMKGVNPLVPHMKYTRNYKTAQLYVQDGNTTFTQMMNSRFDAIRGVSNRRAPTIKRLPLTTTTKNPKHAQLLAECEIDYDRPLTPVEIAAKRAQRLAKEKQTQMASAEQLLQRQGAVNPQQQVQAAKPTVTQQTVQQPVPHQLQQQLQTPVPVHKTVSVPTTNVVPQQTAVVVNITQQNSPITTASPVTIRNFVRPVVQEMVVASSASSQQSTIVIPSTKTAIANTSATNIISPAIQRIIPITQLSTSPTATGQRIVTASGKTLTSSQLQLYRQQHALQLRQQQLKILQSKGGKSVMVPTNVVVTSQQQQSPQQAQPQQQIVQQPQTQIQAQTTTQQTPQRQLVKSVAGTVTTSTTRNLTDAEMAAIIKKQQQQQQQQQQLQQQKITTATVIATTNATITPAQFITAQSSSVGGQNTVGVTLPTIKTTAIGANIKATAGTAQQRQLILQQQYLTQQQRKLSGPKLTSIGQVMVNVTQSGGQVISHVLTKTAQGNIATAAQLMGARVIPVVTSNSAGKLQVVNASALRAANAPNVTVDTTSGRHIQQTLPSNAIKISSGTSPVSVAAFTHQQNFLNQVSAAMQNTSTLAVRQGNVRIQSTAIATGTVSSPSANVTTPSANTANIPLVQAQPQNNDKMNN